MSVRFDASTDGYTCAVTGLDGTDFTMMGWVKLVTDTNAWTSFFGADTGSTWTMAMANADGTSMVWTTSAANVTGPSMTVDVWYFFACVFSTAGTDTLYWADADDVSLTTATAASLTGVETTMTWHIGNNVSSEFLNGECAAVKVWTAALSAGDVEAERFTWQPVRTANLWANWSFEAGAQTADDSGNGHTLTAAGTPVAGASEPPLVASATVEQEGFRFRNDDGSQTGATWLAAQDTAATVALDTPFRLRTVLDTTDDYPSTQFQLEYTEDGTSDWRAIGVGAGDDPIVVTQNTAALTASRSPTVTFTGQGANILENDVVVFFASSSVISATMTEPATWVNPLGAGVDVESDAHQLVCAYHIVTAAEDTANTDAWTVTNWYGANVTGNTIGVVLRGINTSGVVDLANSALITGNSTTHVLASLAGASLSDRSIVIRCTCSDGTGTYSNIPGGNTAIQTSNSTTAKWVGRRDALTTAGVDVAASNITISTTNEYASISVAFAAIPLGTPAVTYATSANFADGDATTAQLTVPTGSPTFTAGVMVEGQALADAVDIVTDCYTEVEWALEVQSPAVDTDVFDFRVTAAGTPLTTYTVTPSLTVGAGATPPSIPVRRRRNHLVYR